MSITSKVDICNMALAHLGNYGTVNDIDSPETSTEKTFALWYDVTRKRTLELIMPNFSLARDIVSQSSGTPSFGYGAIYEYPKKALKILGIGDIDERRNNYSIEKSNGRKAIVTNEAYPAGMPIRYIEDIEDVNAMDDGFKMTFSMALAANVCLPVTQDVGKKKLLLAQLPDEMSATSASSSQENRPIRVSSSKFRSSRYNSFPGYTGKR